MIAVNILLRHNDIMIRTSRDFSQFLITAPKIHTHNMGWLEKKPFYN